MNTIAIDHGSTIIKAGLIDGNRLVEFVSAKANALVLISS